MLHFFDLYTEIPNLVLSIPITWIGRKKKTASIRESNLFLDLGHSYTILHDLHQKDKVAIQMKNNEIEQEKNIKYCF